MRSNRVPAIEVLNLDDAEKFEPTWDDVCISITSPTIEARLAPGWRAVLALQFHDADHFHVVRGVEPMSVEQARKVVEFALEHRDADRIVIHCEAGISRSPGVALALHEILTGDPVPASLEKHYGLHNRLVRSRVLAANGARFLNSAARAATRDA